MSDQQAPVEVTPKFWWDSKTIRFNVVVGALSLVGAIALFLLDSARAGLLPFEIDARWLLLIVGVINVVNLWLRSQTSQPLTRSKQEDGE